MAHTGQTLENPASGERITFRQTSANTGGELLAIDLELPAGRRVPGGQHIHPKQEERFEVVEGTMRFRMGRKRVVAGPGEVVVVPPGQKHDFANVGDKDALVRVEVRPALKMEQLFETAVGLAQQGRTMPGGIPRPLDLALFTQEFEDEVQGAFPPRLAAAHRSRTAGLGGEAPAINRDRHRGRRGPSMSRRSPTSTLVLGGTGKTGRRVVERLTARGLPVRVGSRSGEPRFDWEDRSTWGAVLEGVGSAYVSHYWDALPGAAEALGSFADLAVESGVPRLVLLSGRGEEEAERGERAVRDSGAELTVLRSTWFAQNFSEDYWQEQVQSNEVALPAGDTPEPFVDADDIADVAVAALTDDRHIGEVYELTGPRLLTFAEAVQEISRAVGREIRYVPISIEDFAAAAADQGVPSEVVEMLAFIFGEVLDGRNARLADGVQRALGRAPRDFSAYARDAAATGIWNGRERAGEEANRPQRGHRAGRGRDSHGPAGGAHLRLLGRRHAGPDRGRRPRACRCDAGRSMVDNPAFPLTFLAAPALATVALFQALRSGPPKTAGWIVAGLALYTVTAVVTFAIHVPLNEDLKQAGDPSRIGDLAAVHEDFVTPWVAWNIVRTLASTAAFGALVWALVLRGRMSKS